MFAKSSVSRAVRRESHFIKYWKTEKKNQRWSDHHWRSLKQCNTTIGRRSEQISNVDLLCVTWYKREKREKRLEVRRLAFVTETNHQIRTSQQSCHLVWSSSLNYLVIFFSLDAKTQKWWPHMSPIVTCRSDQIRQTVSSECHELWSFSIDIPILTCCCCCRASLVKCKISWARCRVRNLSLLTESGVLCNRLLRRSVSDLSSHTNHSLNKRELRDCWHRTWQITYLDSS